MLNPFFQQGSRSEQNLIQDLINEQLRMYGVEIHYLPRKYLTEKTVLREVIQSAFDDAYPIEAYVENFEGYSDNTTILSKFGIQSTQEITLVVSKERWENYIQPLIKNESNVRLTSRPKEGAGGGGSLYSNHQDVAPVSRRLCNYLNFWLRIFSVVIVRARRAIHLKYQPREDAY